MNAVHLYLKYSNYHEETFLLNRFCMGTNSMF
jgi:hypothetical protein